ncbi:TetR family transcriptional regulator [Microbacterium sp. ProA8]|jgi:DNA-binding transcriptional regulator YbjK|uniref:TetR/AcrR family transcriptional regulator n=1 Tax=Microbacterium chionoecetis TaxID=3153754 RepID=UPI0032651A37
MASTRDRALDAAVALVGEQGIRALTHARVDERAGLPKGSTSNWFRTRDALIAGVVTWIAESERADFGSDERPAIETPEQLIDALSGAIALQTGPLASRTKTRYAIFLECAGDAELLAPLLAQRRVFVDWTIALLTAVGARSPRDAARALMATGEGLVLHRMTVDPDAEIRPVIERAVRAALD